MPIFFKNLYHPERFRGANKKHNYFEGWYYKFVNSRKDHSVAFIPGIFISKDSAKNFSFIQFLDGLENKSKFFRFQSEQFNSKTDDFKVVIADKNIFTGNFLKLDIRESDYQLSAEFKIKNSVKLPSTIMEPGIMGWYSYIPFMECNHALIALICDIEGKLLINGKLFDFSGGRGYIEKDWGAAFPEAYIWMQGSSFSGDGSVSITGSVAIIPWIRNSFRGFIFALSIRKKIIRFATYNGSKLLRFKVDGAVSLVEIQNAEYKLQIDAEKKTAVILAAPYNGSMEGRIAESLDSIIKIKLSDSKTGKIIFEGESIPSAVEIAGNIEKLLSYK